MNAVNPTQGEETIFLNSFWELSGMGSFFCSVGVSPTAIFSRKLASSFWIFSISVSRVDIFCIWSRVIVSVPVDLDDLNTYPEEWLTMSTYMLWRKVWLRAGESLFYMQFLNPDTFTGMGKEQVLRVWTLCDELVKLWRDKVIEATPSNHLKLMKCLFRFEDETENQC